MTNKYLNRAQILAVEDYKTAEVEVPEWDGIVRLRELSAAQVENIGFDMAPGGQVDASRARGLMTKLVAWSAIDASGERLFTEADVEELGDKSFEVISRLATVVMELTGLEQEEKEEGEPAEKNA